MDIRDLIIDKKYEIDLVKYGTLYTNDMLIENFVYGDVDITTEGIGAKLSSAKDRIIAAIKKIWEKVKKWLLKIYNNLKIMVTPGAKLVSKYGDRLLQLYKEKGNSITVNSVKYKIDEDGLDDFITNVGYEMLKISEYFNECLSTGREPEPDKCVMVMDTILIVNDHAYVSRGGVLHFIKPCVITDDTSTQRKLTEAISEEDFITTLKGEDELKRIKKIITNTEKQFKEEISNLEAVDTVKSNTTGEEVEVDKKIISEIIKFLNGYCKASTCAVDCYMDYFKDMYRFVGVVSKKMLKKYGTKDGVNEKDDDKDEE